MPSEIVGELDIEAGKMIRIRIKSMSDKPHALSNIILYPRDRKYKLLIIEVKVAEG